MIELKSWTLPLIVTALVVPIIGGFLLAGPPLGLGLGLATVAALAMVAISRRYEGPIETAVATGERRHVLVVLTTPLDKPESIERVRSEVAADGIAEPEILVLSPAAAGFLDRWASDVRSAQVAAQQRLVVTIASLGKAGIRARASVGDEGIVQSIEDRLRSFPADKVILATGPSERDEAGERAAEELDERLTQPLARIICA